MPKFSEVVINNFLEPIKDSATQTLLTTENYLSSIGLVDPRPKIRVSINEHGVEIAEGNLEAQLYSSIVDATSNIGRKRLLAATMGVVFASAGFGAGVHDVEWLLFTASQSGFDTPTAYFNLTQLPLWLVQVGADAGAIWAGARAMQRFAINSQKLDLLKHSEQERLRSNG